jgi:hypothetical protein
VCTVLERCVLSLMATFGETALVPLSPRAV